MKGLRLGALAFLCLISMPFIAYAAPEQDCLKCHKDRAAGKSVHEAVRLGCKVCHLSINTEKIPHNFLGTKKGLPTSDAALCFSCHDKHKYSGKSGVHSPVALGMCTLCHDPHSSAYPKLLITQNVCINCHDVSAPEAGGMVHAPVAAGMCTGCHLPHKSNIDKLLKENMQGLCFQCHDKSRFDGKMIHTPVGFGMCSNCHDPHRSKLKKLLISDGQALCTSCHDLKDIQKKEIHQQIGDMSCLVCHAPHASNQEHLLR